MTTTNPKYRRKLNPAQLEVLKLLYRFRFASSDVIAQYSGKSSGVFVYKRLKILQEQGYIIKRFDSSYRIQGKPATYCLSPMGGRVLQEHEPPDVAINIKGLYKNKVNSEAFVRRCIDMFIIHNQLKVTHGDALKFFTKSEIGTYDYFPQPLPDAYFRLKKPQQTNQFFINLCYGSQPFFTLAREAKKFIEYAELGDWDATGTDLPVMLIVCESYSLQKRLQKLTNSALDSSDDEVKFALTTQAALLSGKSNIWQLTDDPEVMLALDEVAQQRD